MLQLGFLKPSSWKTLQLIKQGVIKALLQWQAVLHPEVHKCGLSEVVLAEYQSMIRQAGTVTRSVQARL